MRLALPSLTPARTRPDLAPILIWVLTGFALLLYLIEPRFRVEIASSRIRKTDAQIYLVRVGPPPWSPIIGVSDNLWDNRRSRLALYEDGRKLAPGNALHSLIRDSGKGAYSYWDGALHFSASDNSDPRDNRRTYSADVPLSVGIVGWLTLLGLHLFAVSLNRHAYMAFANGIVSKCVHLCRVFIALVTLVPRVLAQLATIVIELPLAILRIAVAGGTGGQTRGKGLWRLLEQSASRAGDVLRRAGDATTLRDAESLPASSLLLRIWFWRNLSEPRRAWKVAGPIVRSEIVFVVLVAALPIVVPYFMGVARMLFVDVTYATMPMKLQAIRAMMAGDLPLWSPELGMGLPMVGDGITQPYDPRNIWWFLLSPLDAYVAMLATSRSIYMVIAYLYFRLRLGFAPGPALASCCVYFCGTLSVMEVSFTHLATALEAVPMLAWLAEKVVDRPGLQSALNFSFGWLAVLATSSVAYFIFIPFLIFAWGFMLDVYGPAVGRMRRLMRFSAWFWAAIIWGLVLFALVLLPFAEMLGLSNRGTEYINDAFAWRSLWGLLIGPTTVRYGILNSPFSYFFYVGVIAVPLILMSFVERDDARLNAIPWLASLTLGGIFILSTPIKPLIATYLPIVNTFAFFRVSFYWGFLAAILVGYALNRSHWRPTAMVAQATRGLIVLQAAVIVSMSLLVIKLYAVNLELPEYAETAGIVAREVIPPSLAFVSIVYGLIRLIGLMAMLKPGAARRRGAIGTLLIIELLAFFTFFNLGPSKPMPQTDEVAFLRQQATLQQRTIQILDFTSRKPGLVGEDDWSVWSLHLNGKAWWPEIRSVDVYSSLMPSTTWTFFKAIGGLPAPWRGASGNLVTERADSPLLPLLAARWLISRHELDDGPYSLAFDGLNYRIYERKDALPRAYGVFRAVEASNPTIEEMLSCVGDGQVKPGALYRSVWIAPAGDRMPPPRRGTPPTDTACLIYQNRMDGMEAPPIAPAKVISDIGSKLIISATMPQAGWLVVSDNYYPGWSVTVNGKATAIRQANLFARAVEVPAGDSQVVFTYWPDSQRYGLMISGSALALSLMGYAVLFVGRRHRRFREAQGS